jgi:hypothetical protein
MWSRRGLSLKQDFLIWERVPFLCSFSVLKLQLGSFCGVIFMHSSNNPSFVFVDCVTCWAIKFYIFFYKNRLISVKKKTFLLNMLSIDWKRDKNRINTGLFRLKTGLLGNERKTPFSTSANTKTESRKYENGRKNVENGTVRYRKNSVRFHP